MICSNDFSRSEAPLKTLVLLCQDLASPDWGLDLAAIQTGLRQQVPTAQVQVVPDLEHRLDELADMVRDGGAARLVLGLCSGRDLTPRIQAQARKAGLDPLGIEVLNLGAWAARVHPSSQATDQARVLLIAAIARAQAFPGSRPENVRPHLPPRLSRRALFTLSLLEYRAVPSILAVRCAAPGGCRLCVSACPRAALQAADGRVTLDKLACDGCGLCVSACPREAIAFPGHAPAQLAAQIRALLDPGVAELWPRGILFTCRGSAPGLARQAQRDGALPAGWFPVAVPCLGMVLPTWPLACLALGAAAVALAPCPGRCPFAQDETIAGRVAYCRELLRLLDDDVERVRLVQDLADLPPLPATAPHPPVAPASLHPASPAPDAAAQVHLHLARTSGAPTDLSLPHPHAPFGLIRVRDGCTGCGVCATTCPTGALTLERSNGDLTLTFDAALCVACSQCLPVCPEAANEVLSLERVTDLRRLAEGRVTLYEDREWRCEVCGAPIAPEGMLRRIEALLGDEHATTLGVIARYCPRCRATV
jgi:ferredoxin